MPITIQSARATVPAVPQSAGPSKTKLSDQSIAYTTTAALNSGFHIVFGSSVGPPLTFAGLGTPIDNLLNSTDSLSVRDAGPRQAYSLSYNQESFAAFTIGDHVWCCVFETAGALVAGSVPDAVFDMGVVTA
jgi:hypothetical protein